MSHTVILTVLLLTSGCAQKLYEYDPGIDSQSSLCPCIKITPEQMTRLENSAMKDDSEAALILAKYYGSTVKDSEEELFWFKVAGIGGNTTGMINAGYSYEQLNQPEKAVAWYLRASKKEPGEAYARMARLYENHLALENHLVLARKYYKKAALHGKISVISSAIRFAREGIGGEKDNTEAYAWILIQNHTLHPGSWAEKELNELRITVQSEMDKEEISRAEEFYKKYLSEIKRWRQNLLPNCERDGVGC